MSTHTARTITTHIHGNQHKLLRANNHMHKFNAELVSVNNHIHKFNAELISVLYMKTKRLKIFSLWANWQPMTARQTASVYRQHKLDLPRWLCPLGKLRRRCRTLGSGSWRVYTWARAGRRGGPLRFATLCLVHPRLVLSVCKSHVKSRTSLKINHATLRSFVLPFCVSYRSEVIHICYKVKNSRKVTYTTAKSVMSFEGHS